MAVCNHAIYFCHLEESLRKLQPSCKELTQEGQGTEYIMSQYDLIEQECASQTPQCFRVDCVYQPPNQSPCE